jgi:hypothetical protein
MATYNEIFSENLKKGFNEEDINNSIRQNIENTFKQINETGKSLKGRDRQDTIDLLKNQGYPEELWKDVAFNTKYRQILNENIASGISKEQLDNSIREDLIQKFSEINKKGKTKKGKTRDEVVSFLSQNEFPENLWQDLVISREQQILNKREELKQKGKEAIEKQLTPQKFLGVRELERQALEPLRVSVQKSIQAGREGVLSGSLERSNIYSKAMLGLDTIENAKEQASKLPKIPEPDKEGVINQVVRNTAEILPFVARSLGAGAAGFLGGLPIGQPAILSRLGAFTSSFLAEGGSTFGDLIEQGVEPEVARPTAIAVGAVNGTLEIAQLTTALKFLNILPGKKGLFTKKLTDKLINNKALRDSIVMAAEPVLKFSKTLGGEVGIEILQEGVTTIGEETGKLVDSIKNEKEYKTPEAKEIFDRFTEVTKKSALGFSGLLLGGAVITKAVKGVKEVLPEKKVEKPEVKPIADVKKDSEKAKIIEPEKKTKQISNEDVSAVKRVNENILSKELIKKPKFDLAKLPIEQKEELQKIPNKKTKESFDLAFKEFSNELKKPKNESVLNPAYKDITRDLNTKDFHKSTVDEAIKKGIDVKPNVIKEYPDLSSKYELDVKPDRLEVIRQKLKNVREEGRVRERVLEFSLKSSFLLRDDLRKQVVDYVREVLPIRERGVFIGKILPANTVVKVNQIFNQVKDKVNSIYKKKLTQVMKLKVKDALKKIPKSRDAFKVKEIGTEYRKRVQDLLVGIDLIGNKKKNELDSLNRSKFTSSVKQIAKEINMPDKAVLGILRLSDKSNIKEFSIDELESLLSYLDILITLGKRDFDTKKQLWEAEREIRKEELLSGISKKINDREIRDTSLTLNDLTAKDRISNFNKKTLNFFGELRRDLLPSDLLFDDVFDNKGNQKGVHFLGIKRPLDRAEHNHYVYSDNFIEKATDIVNKNNLNEKNFRRISVAAHRSQLFGKDYLKAGGLSDEQIESVKLTAGEQELHNFFRKSLNDVYDDLNNFMVSVFNKEVGFIENFFPVFRKYFNTTVLTKEVKKPDGTIEKETIEPSVAMSMDMLGHHNASKNVYQGFTLKRGGDKVPINLDSFKAFEKYITSASWLINAGREIRMISEIINSKEYKGKIGDAGFREMKAIIDLYARRGGKTGQDSNWEILFRTLRQNFVIANIAARTSTLLVNSTSILDGMRRVGSFEVYRASKAFFNGDKDSNGKKLNSKELRKWILRNMPKIKKRIGGDPDYLIDDFSSWFKKAQDKTIKYTLMTDKINSSIVAYGAYKKALKKRGIKFDFDKPNREAILDAESDTAVSQATNIWSDLPLAISAGKGLLNNKELNKSVLLLNTFNIFRFSSFVSEINNDIKNGNYIEASRKSSLLASAYGMEVGLRMLNYKIWAGLLSVIGVAGMRAFNDISDDEFLERFSKEYIRQILTTIPLMSNIFGLRYGRQVFPAFGDISDFVKRPSLLKPLKIFGVPFSGQLETTLRMAKKAKKAEKRRRRRR